MIRLLELFGGIGSPRQALEKLGVEYEVVGYIEIDKYAVKSYNAIYNEAYAPRDIRNYYPRKADKGDIDIVFHGSPCQDFSIAGHQAGGAKDSGTRSSLLWETLRIVRELRPTYVIWENVRNVLNKKHKPVVDAYIKELEELGYASSYEILNALDFGIPQHRKRVFCVSKLNANVEDIKFPAPVDLEDSLKDLLQNEPVDDKYYYSEDQSKDVIIKYQEVAYCIDANYHKGINPKDFNKKKRRQLVQVPGELGINGHDILKRVYDTEGSSPTLNAMTGGNRQPKVIVDGIYTDQMVNKKATAIKGASPTIKAQYGHAGAIVPDIRQVLEESVDDSFYLPEERADKYKDFNNIHEFTRGVRLPAVAASRGRNPKNTSDRTPGAKIKQRLEVNPNRRANTLTTVGKDNYILEKNWRIRKLTPRECWRLMGFPDSAFDRASEVNSNTQLYKQAGNSIVVDVVSALYESLGIVDNNKNKNREVD